MRNDPERFGRYVVREVLGHGGMGAVYLAHDELLHRDVALKTMLAFGMSGPMAEVFTQRFFVEARAASAVTHANVVQIFDMGVHENVPYLVMELVRGRSLKARLAERLMDGEEARALGGQLARALGVAHAAGILHRDVKPANVLEAEPGVWKLADFGVAKMGADSSLTVTGQFIGSPAYAAPEAFTRGEFTPAGDIYSLGATLYEALTGSSPYGNRDQLALVVAMAREKPRALEEVRPDLPRALTQAVAAAMAAEPAQRPTAIGFAAMLADTSAYVTAPTVATPTPVLAPATAARRRWPWPLLAAGLALVFVGVGIGAASNDGGPAGGPPTPWSAAAITGAAEAPRTHRSRQAQKQWEKAQDKLADGKLREAAKHLEELLEKDPDDAQAAALLQQIRRSGHREADD